MTLSTSESDNNNVRNMENESIPTAELQLLAKLEAANKLIESDSKSLNSLQSSAHSRKSSDTSQISLNSGEYKTIFFVIISNINCFESIDKNCHNRAHVHSLSF